MRVLSPNHLIDMEVPLVAASNPVSSRSEPEVKVILGWLMGEKIG